MCQDGLKKKNSPCLLMKPFEKYVNNRNMVIQQYSWSPDNGFWPKFGSFNARSEPLILIFGHRPLLTGPFPLDELRRAFPGALFFGCSTAGEICDVTVSIETVQITLIFFQKTSLKTAFVPIADRALSSQAGMDLAQSLDHEDLVHVMVLSDGLEVNGSELVEGLRKGIPAHVSITGGLSADMEQFSETVVLTSHGFERKVAAIVGFYGSAIEVGYGSVGGWDPFGPIRLITRSDHNTLYELDGKSALELYKTYLGEHAAHLPAAGLLFPISLMTDPQGAPLVRTVLATDEKAQSMTFAGNLPQGAYARLMKANMDRLIDGASRAAQINTACHQSRSLPQLGILISCVGRRMVLGQRVEEEVEAVKEVLGRTCRLTGFYSYGEISPIKPGTPCELHNQTMTVTTLTELP